MKSMFLLLLGSLITMGTIAQNVQNPFPRTINVNGSAEMEITPDELYVQVLLKEYEKKGKGKVGIESIRQEFLAAVKSLGLPDTSVTVASYGGDYGNPWWRKKNKLKDELYASITYEVKLRSSAQVDQLVDKLDDEATQNFYIARTSHSQMEAFKKQLKMEAIRNAKEKAAYLAQAIDEKIGVAVTINEPNEYFQPYVYRMANAAYKSEGADQADIPQADYKKMKLKYDVNVVFSLQ